MTQFNSLLGANMKTRICLRQYFRCLRVGKTAPQQRSNALQNTCLWLRSCFSLQEYRLYDLLRYSKGYICPHTSQLPNRRPFCPKTARTMMPLLGRSLVTVDGLRRQPTAPASIPMLTRRLLDGQVATGDCHVVCMDGTCACGRARCS